jgi:hypothetical protein
MNEFVWYRSGCWEWLGWTVRADGTECCPTGRYPGYCTIRHPFSREIVNIRADRVFARLR